MNSKIICPCGVSVNHNYYRIHIYSKKHLDFINNKPIKDYAECYNEDLFDNLNEEMNDLDNNKLNMKENDYINKCNKLLENYKENKKKSLINSYGKLIIEFQKNNRLYNKIISGINYKNHSILVYQNFNNIYFNYYLINQKIFIIKINYLNYILYTSHS
jgi:hypothetical protein